MSYMNVSAFLDTNILVYAATGDEYEKTRRERALDLFDSEDFALSAQVLQEFYVTVTRKLEVPLTAEEALEWIEQFEAFPCIAVDTSLVKIGIETSARYQTSYWDGAIIAAAEACGARTLYTEDLNHGQRYGAVTAINPFLDDGQGDV